MESRQFSTECFFAETELIVWINCVSDVNHLLQEHTKTVREGQKVVVGILSFESLRKSNLIVETLHKSLRNISSKII